MKFHYEVKSMCKKVKSKDGKTPASTNQTSPHYYCINNCEEQLLLEQIKYLQSERCSIQSSFLSIISISLVSYGLMLYYAFDYDLRLEGKVNYFFIVLPFLFALSFYNTIKYTMKILGIGSYIRYLEGTINKKNGKAIFQWQSYLVQANGYGLLGGVAQAPCYLIIASILVYKFLENIGKNDLVQFGKSVFPLMLFAEAIILLVGMIFCIMENMSITYWCNTITTEYDPKKHIIFRTRIPHWIFPPVPFPSCFWWLGGSCQR